MSLYALKGKTAVVTGAGSGIGAATAVALARAGAAVVLGDLDQDRAAGVADEIRAAGGDAVVVQVDVSDFAAQKALVAAAVNRHGRLDIFYANAGMTIETGFLNSTPEIWRRLVEVNLLGAAYSLRAALPFLRETKGHMLFTSSLSGHVTTPGSLYGATKHGVTNMADALRLEVNGALRVTCIKPGLTRTNVFAWRGGDPMHGMSFEGAMEPEDVAAAVMYAVLQPQHVDVSEIVVRTTAHSV
jgi:NADP-dependent 3-hydroxy acid dehydrogenase YdfG